MDLKKDYGSFCLNINIPDDALFVNPAEAGIVWDQKSVVIKKSSPGMYSCLFIPLRGAMQGGSLQTTRDVLFSASRIIPASPYLAVLCQKGFSEKMRSKHIIVLGEEPSDPSVLLSKNIGTKAVLTSASDEDLRHPNAYVLVVLNAPTTSSDSN